MIKRVFASAVHMSTGWSLNKPGQYDWLDGEEAKSFGEFLLRINSDPSIQEIILLGDIMDDWVYPVDVKPPAYDAIAAARHIADSNIMNNLKQLASNKKVTYVQGNHDITLFDSNFAAFRTAAFPNMTFAEHYETAEGIYAEHGHQHVMYNAFDPDNKLPIGHYISRLAASVEANKQKKCRQPDVLSSIFPADTVIPPRFTINDPFINLPLSFLANKLDADDSLPIMTTDGDTITLGDVRHMYADLSIRWASRHGLTDPLASAIREGLGLRGAAGQVAIEKNKKVVIFGHTHVKELSFLGTPSPVVSPTPYPDSYAIYANCGSWCSYDDPHPKPYTYVVTEYDEDSGKHTVKLKYWRQTAEEKLEILN